MPKKKSIFSRGYGEVRERLSEHPKFTRSCFNCAAFYQEFGDTEEVCQDPSVLEYDMVVDGNNIYCLKWRPSTNKNTEQQSRFKRGRSRLD